MATIRLRVEKFTTKRQQQLMKMLDDPNVRKEVNTRIGKAINEFVPKKTGELRRSMRINDKSISWGQRLKYAQYQYGGEVYGPNIPGIAGGNPAWRSLRSKHPTGREIGAFNGTLYLRPRWSDNGIIPKEKLPYRFGYTEPGTGHHWDRFYTYRPKLKANQEITRYLKRECKRRGLRT